MPHMAINGVSLFFEAEGTGHPPIVMVHGSWTSHVGWSQAAAELSKSHRVVTYDRRGHSRSEAPPGQGSVRDDAADLAALIEYLDLAPAWIVANSFGASIAIRFAGERPELIAGLACHEPPFMSILAGSESFETMLHKTDESIRSIVGRIAAGDHRGAAEQFVEEVGLGPGSWEHLPDHIRETLVSNAPTFLDESNDPEQLVFDPGWLENLNRPILLTGGSQSPPTFPPIIAEVAKAAPQAEVFTFGGAGHIPHITHTEQFTDTILSFIRRHSD